MAVFLFGANMARQITITLTAKDNASATFKAYSRNVKEAGDATKAMGQQTDQAANNFAKMEKAIAGFLTLAVARKVIGIAEEMNELGIEVNAVSQRFEALASPLGNTTALMDRLRKATLDVASDMEIQSSATRLLQMGIATSADDLQRFFTIATALKQPTESVSQSLENMALMIANTSFLRLDSLGISASAVRTRMAELREETAGMSKEFAFAQAFLEEAEGGMGRLGSAATVAGTSFHRLQTDVTNATQRMAQEFSNFVENAATGLEFVLGVHPLQTVIQEHVLSAQMEQAGRMASAAFERGMISQNEEISQEFLTAFFASVNRLAATGQPLEMRRIFAGIPPELQPSPETSAEYVNRYGYLVKERDLLYDLALVRGVIADEQDRIAQKEAEITAAAEERMRIQEELVRKLEREAEAAQLTSDLFALERMFPGVPGIERGFTDILGGDADLPQYMSEEAAANMQRIADEAARILEDMSALDELDDAMFTDDQIAQAKTIADETGRLAKEADKAAAAFEKIKLSDVFGQGGGGMAGEIGDAVIAQMQNAGATEEQIAMFKRQFDIGSGRETASSLAFQEQVVPFISDIGKTFGAGEATQAISNLQYFLQQAALMGTDVNALSAADLRRATGYDYMEGGAAPQIIVVAPGDTAGALAGKYGMSVSEILAAAGVTDPRLLQPGEYGAGGPGIGMIPGFDAGQFAMNPAAYQQNQPGTFGMNFPTVAPEQMENVMNALAGVAQAAVNFPDMPPMLGPMMPPAGMAGIDFAQAQGESPFLSLSENIQAASEPAQTMGDIFTGMAEHVTGIVNDITGLPEHVEALVEPGGKFSDQMSVANDAVKGVKNALDGLTSKIQRIKVVLDVSTNGDDFMKMVEHGVKANGGKVPGAVEK